MENCDKKLAKHLEELAVDSKFGRMNFDVLISQTEQYLKTGQEPKTEPNKSFYLLVKSYLDNKKLTVTLENVNGVKLQELLEYTRKGG